MHRDTVDSIEAKKRKGVATNKTNINFHVAIGENNWFENARDSLVAIHFNERFVNRVAKFAFRSKKIKSCK